MRTDTEDCQTVGDVIEFWRGYVEQRRDYLTEEQVLKGCAMIAEDCAYWCDRGMGVLADRVMT